MRNLCRVVYNSIGNIIQIHFLLSILMTRLCLGEKNIGIDKITAGFDCYPRTVPFLASIALEKKIICGGTVLSSHWAMTAAHCMSKGVEKYIVWTGIVRTTRVHTQSARIKRIIIHDKYVKHKAKPESNDICLLELKTPVKENPITIYVRIPSTKMYQSLIKFRQCNESLTFVFGSTNIFENQTVMVPGQETNTLQCAFHTIKPDEYCKKFNEYMDSSTMLCAHGSPVTVGVCYKDSGGPLICQGMQVGIVSATFGCGLGNPVFLVKVAAYNSFISKYVRDLKVVNSNAELKLEMVSSIICLTYYIIHIYYIRLI